mmetsp:Transcript_23236/g.39366  ORF Transcript_23236/g.39366 Transcript_23236/m.39366 type:complete len:90 (+) Transcript_23236:13-282(+)|eukprot:CAMPEP_0114452940 /NCGR_PEP_ID=MMETSP0104-20121206/1778_1 /TAXON_ID=37642 ORGANISM="Paraphysomonas imperforata, Strain PA2" /NCGR_SAMPLE_ID=MMETSP0104 /ASSEMBLY_ACC=CAM_ASM_000202 /LENGTH=89 /DNA_ID=CAMNT_0001625215 /DNA_START=9 /DNA_END=278 /DNA_ORIENTATION=-
MTTRSGANYNSELAHGEQLGNPPVTDEESRYETCEHCSTVVDCFNSNIYILQKNDDDKCVCQGCFEDLEDDWKAEGWQCDDWDSDSDQQ